MGCCADTLTTIDEAVNALVAVDSNVSGSVSKFCGCGTIHSRSWGSAQEWLRLRTTPPRAEAHHGEEPPASHPVEVG